MFLVDFFVGGSRPSLDMFWRYKILQTSSNFDEMKYCIHNLHAVAENVV